MVGENIRILPGVAARVFNALGEHQCPHGFARRVGVEYRFGGRGADLARAVQALHEEFFSELDPAVFDA